MVGFDEASVDRHAGAVPDSSTGWCEAFASDALDPAVAQHNGRILDGLAGAGDSRSMHQCVPAGMHWPRPVGWWLLSQGKRRQGEKRSAEREAGSHAGDLRDKTGVLGMTDWKGVQACAWASLSYSRILTSRGVRRDLAGHDLGGFAGGSEPCLGMGGVVKESEFLGVTGGSARVR